MVDFKICDCHNDFLTELNLADAKEYIEKCRKENVEIISSSFWTSKMTKKKIKEEIGGRAKLVKEFGQNLLFHVEDLWWIEEGDLKDFVELNPFSCSLTWNDANDLAGGAFSNGKLTAWGRKCLDTLIESNVLIDTAHLNRQSFDQVTKIVGKNLYCSHTGLYGVKRHRRNLTDRQIEKIVKSNGFIGLYFYDKAVKIGDEFEILDIVKSLKYFTSHWGIDNIGIGTDFYGIENYPKDLKCYADFFNLVAVMQDEGFDENEIKKIFYQNFKNFCSRINH